jgi:hypothetical protein
MMLLPSQISPDSIRPRMRFSGTGTTSMISSSSTRLEPGSRSVARNRCMNSVEYPGAVYAPPMLSILPAR